MRTLVKNAVQAERGGVMDRSARIELTKQAGTIFKAINAPGCCASKLNNGTQQLDMLGQLTRRVRYAPGGKVTKVGLRSMTIHGQQLRFETRPDGMIGTSESFLRGISDGGWCGTPHRWAPGVKTARTAEGTLGQFETVGLSSPNMPR
jgi:hypothetical protein